MNVLDARRLEKFEMMNGRIGGWGPLAEHTNIESQRMTGAVSIDGQEPRLNIALQSFMTPEFVGACRQSLTRRLTGGAQQDPKECEERERKRRPSQEKLSRIIAGSGRPEDVLEARDQEGRDQERRAQPVPDPAKSTVR